MDYTISGKAWKTLGYFVAWLVLCVNAVLIIFMVSSGFLTKGMNSVWNGYLGRKVYEDAGNIVNSYCFDYIKAESENRHFDQGYYDRRTDRYNTNFRFMCTLNVGEGIQLPGNYDPAESKQYTKTYEFEIPAPTSEEVKYIFDELQFKAFFRQADAEDSYRVYKENDLYYVSGESEEQTEVTATVQCYIPTKLLASDKYYNIHRLLSLLDITKYLIIVAAIMSFAVAFIFLKKLIEGAGKSSIFSETELKTADRIPFDVLLGICAIIAAWAAKLCSHAFTMMEQRVSLVRVIGDIIAVLFSLFLIGVIVLEIALTLTVRIRTKTWFTNNLIYKLCVAVRRPLRQFAHAVISLRAVWKLVLVFGILNIMIVSGIMFQFFESSRSKANLIMFAFSSVCVLALLVMEIILIYNINMMETACDKIAEGNFDYQLKEDYVLEPLRKTAEAVNHISKGMDKALKEQIKSEHFKTELITNVSHDIKTPLTSIITYVNLLQKTKVSGNEAGEYLEVLERQSDKLKKLIEDLVEASKASTGNIELDMVDMDICIMLEQAVGEYEERFRQRSLKAVLVGTGEPCIVHADGQHLWRIIDNLLSNVCKYSLENTRLFIELTENENDVEISFKNVSKYELENDSEELMERFVRGDKSRHTEGSGLGLSIARSLAESMGGELKLTVDGDLFKAVLRLSKVKDEKTESEEKQ